MGCAIINPQSQIRNCPADSNPSGGFPVSQLTPHCLLKNSCLLPFINIVKTSSRARCRFSAYILDVLLDQRGNTCADKIPTSHVFRFLLHPTPLIGPIVLSDNFFKLLFREGVKLLQPDDTNIGCFQILTSLQEFVVNLATAKEDAAARLNFKGGERATTDTQRRAKDSARLRPD